MFLLVQPRCLLICYFLMVIFSSANAQILVVCENVTECLQCAKSNFAHGGSGCSWCLVGNKCFDRYSDPSACDPASTVVLSDAGGRCSMLMGLPLAYGVLVIILIVLIPFIIFAVVLLVCRRMEEDRLTQMELLSDTTKPKGPIMVVQDNNNPYEMKGSNSGTQSPTDRKNYTPRTRKKYSTARRPSRESSLVDLHKQAPLIDVDVDGSLQDSGSKGYRPPAFNVDSPTLSSSKTKISVTTAKHKNKHGSTSTPTVAPTTNSGDTTPQPESTQDSPLGTPREDRIELSDSDT